MYKATPYLANGTPADELPGILKAAKKAIAMSGMTECHFDENGNPTPDGQYETWQSSDGSHQLVSFS